MNPMEEKKRIYTAIDLKSFYASVECMARNLDPLNANLVVADESRTDKTICLAVSPSLKALGISGRPRLFEVKEQMRRINAQRLRRLGWGESFRGTSILASQLNNDPYLEAGFVAAVPRMAAYMAISRSIYSIYLRFVAPEDVHVYSIDEVFIDVTDYLNLYRMNARSLTEKMIRAVLEETGITATAGIGTNLYLAKVAMDIVAKHIPPDEHGVRIAQLDEASYRRLLWAHEPLTDFWRVGKGIAARLNAAGMYTMGDIARRALTHQSDLYDLFGINAEYLIDHAFGEESATMADIRNYVPENRSLGTGQVLPEPYSHQAGRIIIREMAEGLANDLLRKKLLADGFVLYIGYDRTNVSDPERRRRYEGEVTRDYYGREVPRSGGGSVRLKEPTSSAREIVRELLKLYERSTDHSLLIRRVNISAGGLIPEAEYHPLKVEQVDLFTDYETKEKEREKVEKDLARERRAMEAMLKIQDRFGKNAVIKGTSLEEGATGRERNRQIGGHKA